MMSFKSISYECCTYETLTKLVKPLSKDERETLNTQLISLSEFKKKLSESYLCQHDSKLDRKTWGRSMRVFLDYSFWENQYESMVFRNFEESYKNESSNTKQASERNESF